MEMLTLLEQEKELETIYQEFKRLRVEYAHDPIKGSGDPGERERLHYYSDQFTELYTQIRPLCAQVYGYRTEHDDKAASAFKARVARHLQEEDSKLSWNKATEMAAATEEYKDFLKERIHYYQSWDAISHLRDSIKQFIINIGLRIHSAHG